MTHPDQPTPGQPDPAGAPAPPPAPGAHDAAGQYAQPGQPAQPETAGQYAQPYGQPYAQQPAAPQSPRTNGMAVAALVLGILAVLGAWVPIFGFGSAFLGLIGLVLGIIGLRKVVPGVVGGKGQAVTGIVLGALSIVLAIASTVLFANFFNQDRDVFEDAMREAERNAAEIEERSAEEGVTEDDATGTDGGDVPAERVDFSGVTCEIVAEEAVAISAEFADGELLEARDLEIVEDARTDYELPSGSDEPTVLVCGGTGVWSDGAEAPVLLELYTDATGEAFVYYERM